MNDSLTTMNEQLKNLLLGLLVGIAAAFMMYPVLEDWPPIVTIMLTAAVYAFAGYAFCRRVRRGLRYCGLVLNMPLWLLMLAWGFPLERDMVAVLATALIAAHAGMLVALRRLPSVDHHGEMSDEPSLQKGGG